MACKGPHVQDNSVVERRLRPIYEWLDSGNNKKALQECEKVLKKTPNLQCAKALKALALLRNGRESDCVNILETLKGEKPCDDPTLQAMTLCYRELQQPEKIHPLYETAVKEEPTNEELHTHLFMAYVRISDFKAQQQAAMTLYKLKPKNPYYCWAVMSIILQATRGPGKNDEKKRNLLLSLAERMVDKLIADNKLEAEQEVQLYMMILDLQQKYEEILEVIEGPLGEKLINGSLSTNRLPYLIKLKRWHEVNLLCKKILIETVDKWDIWKEYMNSVFHIMNSGGKGDTNSHSDVNHEFKDSFESNNMDDGDNLEMIDDTPEKAHEFICRLVENGSDNGYLLRGPYLARFELLYNSTQQGMDTTDLLGETIELFIEYFRKFGHKPCCVSDLRTYLSVLDDDKKSELSMRLIKDVGISATSVPQTDRQMQRHICALQLARLCSNHRNLSEAHQKALVTALSLHYQHGFQTYGSNLLSTDQGPSDPYALIAVHFLYDIAQSSKKSEPIVLALVLLENLLRNSPSNFHAKLLCVKLYHTLGAGVGAQIMYDSLDIKHLQLDSLGYIHCGRMHSTGLFSLAAGHYECTLKFFISNYKDSCDHLTFSYKFGSFLKLDEFMDFREKLNNSIHYAMVAVERIILNLVVVNSIDSLYMLDLLAKDNNINWDILRDNHDLSVYQCWDPERIHGPPEEKPEIALLFEQDKLNLRLRNQMLLAFNAIVQIAKSTDGIRTQHLSSLKQILKDWEEMYTNIPQHYLTPLTQAHVTYPLPSRLHISLDLKYHQIVSQFFKLVEPVLAEDVDDIKKLLEIDGKSIKDLQTYITDKIASQNEESVDCLWDRRTIMEEVVNICEILSISSLVCILCLQLTKPPATKKTKKKVESKVREYLAEFAGELKAVISKLDKVVESWKPLNEKSDLESRLATLNLSLECQESVISNLKYSHATTDISTLLKGKVKALDSALG